MKSTCAFWVVTAIFCTLSFAGSPESDPPDWVKYVIAGEFAVGIISIIYKAYHHPSSVNLGETEIDAITYLLSAKKQREFKKIRFPEEKKTYIDEFWRSLQSDVAPPKLTRSELEVRSKIATEKFGSLHRPGWKTDRGRVLILYGEPDEINRMYLTHNSFVHGTYHLNDAEIWTYQRPGGHNPVPSCFLDFHTGGMMFVFANTPRIGEFQQIYSTEPGEVLDLRLFK